ncbi:hypothetical protein SLS62_008476 [Diatrype stigma]|uniref:Uncharacterized protein n=1 Tax=Diatrype stigma TaxID=117547 RepID=A0AAN9UJN5_9PEZI
METTNNSTELTIAPYLASRDKKPAPVLIDLTDDTDDELATPLPSISHTKKGISTVVDLADDEPLNLKNGIKTENQDQDSKIALKGLLNASSTMESSTDTANIKPEVEADSLFVSERTKTVPSYAPQSEDDISDTKPTTRRQSRKRKAISSNTSTGRASRRKRTTAALASLNKLKGKKSGQDMLKSLFGGRPINADETEEAFPKPKTSSKLKADEKALNEAIKIFGNNSKNFGKEPNGSNDTFITTGMKTPLRDYQLVGAAFMLRHEKARKGPHGGIIADEMGLGKTLQAIACMLAHKPSSKDQGGYGTTLIVMPSDNLITQWLAEFSKHIDQDAIKEPLHYKQRVKLAEFALKAYDFIFATYAQVQLTYKKSGPLFQIEFYRIILDEADKIKNMNASKILPYMEFIGINADNIQDLGHNGEDQEDFPQPKRLRMKGNEDRVMKVINDRMLRRWVQQVPGFLVKLLMKYRQKGEIFNGRQICELPACHESVHNIKMTEEEGLIYRCIEATTLRLLKEAIGRRGSGTELPNDYRLRYFVLLTRLRQAVDHPLLLYTWMKNIIPSEDIRKLLNDLAKIHPKTSVYDQIVASSEDLLSTKPQIKLEGFGTDKPDVFFNFDEHLNYVLDSKDNEGCIACFEESEVRQLECGHLLCDVCLTEQLAQIGQQGTRSLKCPECDKVIYQYQHEDTPDMDDGPSTLFTSTGRVKLSQPSATKPPAPGDDSNGLQPKTKKSLSKWLELSDRNANEPLTPSAKTTAAMECIKGWQLEAPDDKIIVFVQWGITAKVIGRMLGVANIPFLYYWGDMTPQQRGNALEDFKTKSNIKVLVAGLKCGNQGLNITCANRAILLSPWWNRSVEDQAKGRICRHGQTKETYVVNIVVKKSIDDRMLFLQQRKMEETQPALDKGRAAKPLTEEERLWLFGAD